MNDFMTGLWRFIKFTGFFLLVIVPLMLIGYLLLLIVCPFVSDNQIRLPRLFKWWDNADDYLGRDTSVYRAICGQGWWARYCYIAWRNPINYFGYVYCGLKWNGHEVYTRYNPDEDNIGDGTRPGFRHIEVTQLIENGKKYYFEYYWIYVYPFKKDVCFRYRMGWKISDKNNPVDSISQWCFVISPWHNFSGKSMIN